MGAFGQREDLAERLREALDDEGVNPQSVLITVLPAGDDPLLRSFAERRPRLSANRQWPERDLIVASIQRVSGGEWETCLLYTSPSPRDLSTSRMPSSA